MGVANSSTAARALGHNRDRRRRARTYPSGRPPVSSVRRIHHHVGFWRCGRTPSQVSDTFTVLFDGRATADQEFRQLPDGHSSRRQSDCPLSRRPPRLSFRQGPSPNSTALARARRRASHEASCRRVAHPGRTARHDLPQLLSGQLQSWTLSRLLGNGRDRASHAHLRHARSPPASWRFAGPAVHLEQQLTPSRRPSRRPSASPRTSLEP